MQNKNKKIIVISHQRSGTHFLIGAIALNFPWYSHDEINLSSVDVINPSKAIIDSNVLLLEKGVGAYF